MKRWFACMPKGLRREKMSGNSWAYPNNVLPWLLGAALLASQQVYSANESVTPRTAPASSTSKQRPGPETACPQTFRRVADELQAKLDTGVWLRLGARTNASFDKDSCKLNDIMTFMYYWDGSALIDRNGVWRSPVEEKKSLVSVLIIASASRSRPNILRVYPPEWFIDAVASKNPEFLLVPNYEGRRMAALAFDNYLLKGTTDAIGREFVFEPLNPFSDKLAVVPGTRVVHFRSVAFLTPYLVGTISLDAVPANAIRLTRALLEEFKTRTVSE